MLFYALTSLCFVAGPTWGLINVGPVRLTSNLTYITYSLPPAPNRTLIECPYTPSPGDEVELVTWTVWENDMEVGGYEWSALNKGQEGTGRLQGLVRLDRNDGGLELTNITYDLGAFYSCTVKLTNGESKTSEKEEILVVDVIGFSRISSTDDSINPCMYIGSYTSPAVFPEPTLEAGLFIRSLDKFYRTVSENKWVKMRYSNGSYTYSYTNFVFEVDENSHEDISFKLKLGITKSDGTYIPLTSLTSDNDRWDEKGCEEIEEVDYKEVHYFPSGKMSKLCRGGRRVRTQATMTCMKGYTHISDVMTVKMRCDGARFTWIPEGHANTFEDLNCVYDDKYNGGNGGNHSFGSPNLALLLTSLLTLILPLLHSWGEMFQGV